MSADQRVSRRSARPFERAIPVWSLVAATVVALPVLVGAGYAVAASVGLAGPASGQLSLAHVRRVVADGEVWRGAAWSIYAASASTALAAIAAIAIAATYRGSRVSAQVARAASLASFPMPYVVAASITILFLGQSGLLARLAAHLGLIRLPGQMPALVLDRAGIGFILAFAWKETAFLVLVATSTLARHGRRLEETARTLGATARTAFWRVTLPVLWRGLAPAIILVLVFVTGSYEGAVLLAPSQPLPFAVAIYERYFDLDLSRRGEAFVLTFLGLVLAIVAVVVFETVRSHWEWDSR
jgi:putative spermidine/putrescine transport system permease protein